jgi:hypothetical protein
MHGSRFIFLVLLGLAGAGETHAARAAVGKSEQAPAVESAWSRLDSPVRAIRTTARRAIMAQPFDSWKKLALGETRTQAALEALTALVEACPAAQAEELRPHICEGITTLHIEGMSAAQRLAAVRLTRRVFARLGGPSEDERGQMADLWSHFLPAKRIRRADEQQLATELRALLKFLAPPDPAKKQAHHGRGATNQGTVRLGKIIGE